MLATSAIQFDIYTMLVTCSLSFTALVVILFGIRFYKALHKRYQQEYFDEDKLKVTSYLETLDLSVAEQIISRSRYLKNYIRRLAETVDGDMTQQLLDLYIELGFLDRDLSRLSSWWYYRRVDALTSLRAFQYRLDDEAWDKLLTETRWEFRWATMEYYVSVKGKQSLNRLVSFLSARKNIYQGNLHHLLSHFASINGESIAYLLRFSDDERLREALLKTLSIYPVPGSETIIRGSFNVMATRSVIVAGLEALSVHPDSANLAFLEQFTMHEDQQVRTLLAKNLRHYAGGVDLLANLAIDGSFEVRAQVSLALEELLPYSGTIVAEILRNPQHPCHQFLSVQGVTIPRQAA